ncbi:restriction endonuclease subunit S [Luteimonas mephitis]|uniref:restriction endonuclease subunit S n=1 Tax=Luteimonas mephitis TaxID=83615 RepID=UPI003A8C8B1A
MSVTVSEQLPLLAAAPNGIGKLRELILELAVRGKLVAQDAGDEPASELLKRISVEKKRLVVEGKIKQPKEPAVVALKEELFSLPKGWVWSSLAEAALVNPRNAAEDALAVSFVPMALIGTNFDGIHGQESRLWGEIKQGFTHFAEDDVGVAKITPCFENSKACVFSGLTNGLGAGTTELHIIRPLPSTIDARYVLAYVKSPQFLRVGETRMTGTAGQKRLPKNFVETNPFPVPPLAEQHRIVAKVDELMALCDRLEAQQADAESAHAQLVATLLDSLIRASDSDDFATSWQRLSAHFHTLFTTESSIDALKQAILQLAVTGKLVPQEMASIKIGDLPAGWRELRIDEFCTVQGGIQKTPLRHPVSLHFPYLRVANVQRGRIDVSELARYELSLDELEKWRLNTGDLLIVEGNGSESEIGRCAIWRGEVLDCVYQNHLMRVRPELEEQVNYLALYLNSPLGMAHMKRLAITTSGLFNLSVGKIRSIPVELPPLAEQHRIVAEVEQLMALCDQLKLRLSQARELNEQVATALVQNAMAKAA